MCVTALVMMAASGAMSAYGQIQQGKQQEQNLKFQAAQGEADAKAAQGEAIVEAERIRRAAKIQRSSATAAAAASGVDVSSPTAIRIDEEIVKNSEEDALLTILNGNDRSARMKQQAAVDRQSAAYAKSNSRMAAAGTLLSTAGNVAGNWKTGKTT